MAKEMTNIDFFIKDLFENRDESGNLIIPDIKFSLESREKRGNDKRIKNWIRTQDKKQYLIKTNAKLDNRDNYLNIAELICEEIYKEFEIEYARYDTISFNNEYGIITENMIGYNEELISLEEMLEGAVSHPENVEIIDYKFMINTLIKNLKKYGFKDNIIEGILVELGKRLLIDIVVGATDRHTENISFIYNNKTGDLKLSAVYDTENSLLLENDFEVVDSLAKNLKSAVEISKNIYPKIAMVPRNNATAKEIVYSSIEFIINNENPQVEDFAYELLQNLDIYTIMDKVEKRIQSKLSAHVRAVVSTCIETRLGLLNDILNEEIFVSYDWDYMNSMYEKMKTTVQKNNNEVGVYNVLYKECIIGKYIIEESMDTYVPDFSEIEKIEDNIFPLLKMEIKSKNVTMFSSRISNCNRFGGIIGYQTDNLELKKVE